MPLFVLPGKAGRSESPSGDHQLIALLTPCDVGCAGQVDVASSGQLAARFNLSSTPTAILLRDRAMYSIDLAAVGGTDADRLVAAVQTFLQGGYEQQVCWWGICASTWREQQAVT